MARRLPQAHLGGRWEYPGGKVRPGETAEAALFREWVEELGVEIEVGPRLWRTWWIYPDREVDLAFFAVRITAGVPRGREGQLIRWVRRDEVAALEKPPASETVSRKLVCGDFDAVFITLGTESEPPPRI